ALAPRRSIADLRRAAFAGLVTLAAGRLHDLLSRALGAANHSHGCNHRGFLPIGAGLARHVSDGAFDLDVFEIRVSAFRRHRADALQRMIDCHCLTLCNDLPPRRLVAEFRRARETAFVAVLAHLSVHLLPGELTLRTARRCKHHFADRLDALDDRAFVLVQTLAAAGAPLRKQDAELD